MENRIKTGCGGIAPLSATRIRLVIRPKRATLTARVLRPFLTLALIVMLAGLPETLPAQALHPSERRGADIRVTLVSPGTVSGELIGVSVEKMVIGGGAGYGIATLMSKEKVYEFRGVTPDKISAAIAALQKKARVPDYK